MTCGFVDNSSGGRVIQARPLVSNLYFTPSSTSFAAGAGLVPSANVIYLWPFNQSLMVQGLSAEVTVGAAGSFRLGLYMADDDGFPSDLVEESANLSSAAAAVFDWAFATARKMTLPMWGAINFSATPIMRVGTAASQASSSVTGGVATSSSPTYGAFSTPQAFGAFPPSLAGAVYSTAPFTTTPIVFYKGA